VNTGVCQGGTDLRLRHVAVPLSGGRLGIARDYERIAKEMPVRMISAMAIVEREGNHEAYHAMPHRLKGASTASPEHVPAPRGDAARAPE
jgi:hypothetical protein